MNKRFFCRIFPLMIFTIFIMMLFPAASVSAGDKRDDPLTSAERAWLKEHPVIRLAPDPSSPPLDMFDSTGRYVGLSADYVALIEKKVGIKFQIVRYKTWDEVITAARNRQADVLPSTLMSPERRQYLLFSRVYVETPAVIITRDDVKETLTLDKLRGKKVVVVSGYAWQEMMAKDYPEIDLVTVSDPGMGLRIVSFGGAYAMVNDVTSSSYYLKKENLTNLQVSGETPYGGEMYFACRNDWPELESIINKGLVLITPQEKHAIEDKWISLGEKEFQIREHFLQIVKISLEVVSAIFLLVVFWSWWQIRLRNLRLAKELVERKNIEEELLTKNQELQSAYNKLNESYEQIGALSEEVEKSYRDLIKYNSEMKSLKERLELALRNAGAGMWDWYIQTGELFFNDRYAEIHGYATSELPQDIADWKSRVHPDDWVNVRDLLDAHVEGRSDYYEAEYRIRNKEGGWTWIQDGGKVVSWDDQGKPIRALGIIREITARKEMEFSLKESEQRYREVFDNTSDGIFLLDVLSDGGFRYIAFNQAERTIIGFPSQEYIGRRPQDIFAPQFAGELITNYRRCLEAGTMINYDQVFNLVGEVSYIHNSLIPISDEKGNIYRIIGISQDISERKKNEAAAKAEDKRLRSLVKISQQSFACYRDILDYVLDEIVAFSESHLGYISFYNEEEELFRFYAWSETAMEECAIDNPPMEYILEQTGLWGEAVRQRQVIIINDYQQDNRYKKGYPSGHVELYRFMTLPVFSEGKIVAVVGVGNKAEEYTDLDARELKQLIDSLWKMVEVKQAEQALMQSEENFSKVFYDNPVSMAIVSLDNRRLLEVNEAFEQRSGYRRVGIIGQLLSEVGEWPTRSTMEQLFRDLETNGSSRGRELIHRTPGGKEWLLKVSADVIEFDGQPAALLAVEDISDRRKAEQALISSMALYRGIFTATNNAALLLDIDHFTVLEANPAAQRLYGYTLDELKELDFTQLDDSESGPVVKIIKEDINQAWCKGSSIRRGLARRKDGEVLPVWIYLNIVPIEEKYRVLMVINDLSDEIRYQEEHEKALRYESQAMKMTTISAISAGVVHEISQPLNAIKVLADGIIYRYEIEAYIELEDALDALGKISQQAERINDIVRHMSNLANSVEDKVYTATDINYTVTEAMKILGSQLNAHGIGLEMDLARDLPLVWGLEQILEEVVINLMVNAMYALDEHQITDKKISCHTRREENDVIMEIADNGPGISPDIRNKVWDPFYSTRQGGEGLGLGMGLGLSIVKSIVSRMGGNISYCSNAWGGATFRMEFPVYDPPLS